MLAFARKRLLIRLSSMAVVPEGGRSRSVPLCRPVVSASPVRCAVVISLQMRMAFIDGHMVAGISDYAGGKCLKRKWTLFARLSTRPFGAGFYPGSFWLANYG